MSSSIYKVFSTKRDNGVTVYTIIYTSGRQRIEVENLLPETVKKFIRETKSFSYVLYNAILDRYETVYG